MHAFHSLAPYLQAPPLASKPRSSRRRPLPSLAPPPFRPSPLRSPRSPLTASLRSDRKRALPWATKHRKRRISTPPTSGPKADPFSPYLPTPQPPTSGPTPFHSSPHTSGHSRRPSPLHFRSFIRQHHTSGPSAYHSSLSLSPSGLSLVNTTLPVRQPITAPSASPFRF